VTPFKSPLWAHLKLVKNSVPLQV